MQSSHIFRSAQEASKGVHAANKANTCSPGGAPAPKNEKQTARIHVAIQSVHAVKPSLPETHKKPARALMQPRRTDTCSPAGARVSKHGKQTGRITVAMQSIHAVKPSLQEAHKKPARAFICVHAAKVANTCSPGVAPASKNEAQTGRIHVAIQSVHAVKPSL
jgi:hypothetical protein